MEQQIIDILSNSGVTGFLIVILAMIYKAGKFAAPIMTNFFISQSTNQANIAKTLESLSDLHRVTNTRLEAIEKQLTLIEGLEK